MAQTKTAPKPPAPKNPVKPTPIGKGAEAPKQTEEKKPRAVKKDDRKIMAGEKNYNPRVAKNASAWSIVQSHFGKTVTECLEALKKNSFEVEGKTQELHHVDFLGYMERGKHIVLK